MSILFIILASIALPLVSFTIFLRTSHGQKLKLGSFFIIRNLSSDYPKVRSVKDILLLFLRLAFTAIIALLIFDPSDAGVPGRNTLYHSAGKASLNRQEYRYSLKLKAPGQAKDKFDEDLYFLEAFIKSYKIPREAVVIYNPDEKTADSIKNDTIIFPSQKQGGNAFLKWIDLFEFSDLRIKEARIKDTDVKIRAFYPIRILNSEKIKNYIQLEDGSVIAVSFMHNNHKVLLFGTGISGFWGDIGVSGYFIDIIDDFMSSLSLSEKPEEEPDRSDEGSPGEVRSLMSFGILLKIACFIFLAELILYLLQSIFNLNFSMADKLKQIHETEEKYSPSKLLFNGILKLIKRKKIVLLILLLFPSGLRAEDFKFIELTFDGHPANNKQFFSVIKRELEEKTSIRISPDYYATISSSSLSNGQLPELPYLWILGCPDRLSQKLARALTDFIERGGIIFADLSGAGETSQCRAMLKEISLKISGSAGFLPLPKDHPVYKSFYLINSENLKGADISITTKRTAMIISENKIMQRMAVREDKALKAGVNIVLYMLSGNYKSDQIHTRQILNRLKKRELFK
ncbi:MAG: DUF4159 domain-containing protein [Spirochaetota bacterium]